MKLRSLAASTLLLASVLVGAPAATATSTPAAPATGPAVTAPTGDQSGTDGLNKDAKEWACRNFGVWCD